MTLLVRDEEDVLPANLAFHLEQGVDFFVITEHRSTDSTPDIIRQYELAGLAEVIHEDREDFDQAGWVTRMAHLAAREHGADWVIHNDADEFWWPTEGDLVTTFQDLDERCDVALAPRHDFVAVDGMSEPFHQSMTIRKTTSLNLAGVPLPPKVAHRAHAGVAVEPGNHDVVYPAERQRLSAPIEVLHFPVRTADRHIRQIVNGVEALRRTPDLASWVASTWRDLYSEYQVNGLVHHVERIVHDADRLEAGVRDGSLVEDRRLADFFAAMADRPVRSSSGPPGC